MLITESMGFRSALATLLRDVDRVRTGLVGARAPAADAARADAGVGRKADGMAVAAARENSAPAAPPVRTVGARAVVIEDVVRETDDAVSLVLRDRSGAPFAFAPGQFLTVIVEIAGERVRRSYSISSSADVTDTATITVKRVAGGKVSGHIVEHAHAGMCLEVLGPAGAFTPSPAPSSPRRLVLIAGGSGITPMMSIARTVLAREPDARIDLLYGSRSERDIILKDALDALASQHDPRLVVRHVLGVALDRAGAARELDALDAAAPTGIGEAEYFVCGPEPMMREVRAALAERGVPDAAVREEKFTPAPSLVVTPANDAPRASAGSKTVQLRLTFRDNTTPATEIAIATDVPILQAALAAGVELPYSCTEGVCGTCTVRAADPSAIDMDPGNCLTPTEIKQGCVLTCISRARRDVELVVG